MKRKVLIIDDHLPSKAFSAQALSEEECEVVGEGGDGRSAVELVKILSPDVLLIAVGLPDMDGISAARQILAERPLPIILLTSHYDKDTVERAKTAGVMAYLVKPLRKEELVPNLELAISHFAEIISLRKANEHLKRSLESRKTIERAKGILMKNQGLSEAQAFSLMQKKSMNTQRPMVDIAQAIILTEEMKQA
jgi:AmiR/NasT family two-component response regulator